MTKREFDAFHRTLDKRIIGFSARYRWPNRESYNDGTVKATEPEIISCALAKTGRPPEEVYKETYGSLSENTLPFSITSYLDQLSVERLRSAMEADLRFRSDLVLVETSYGAELRPAWDNETPEGRIRDHLVSLTAAFVGVDAEGEYITGPSKLPLLFGRRLDCEQSMAGDPRCFGIKTLTVSALIRDEYCGFRFKMDTVAKMRVEGIRYDLSLLRGRMELEEDTDEKW